MTQNLGSFFSSFDPAAIGTWPARIGWFAMPVVFRAGFTPATAGLDSKGALGLELVSWFLWFLGLVGVAVHHPLSLTIVRTIAPLPPTAMLTAAILLNKFPARMALVFGYGMVVALAMMLPSFGDAMVNGSAYGPERRFALRPPGFALFGGIPIVWIAASSTLGAGLILAATNHVAIGLPIILLGSAITFSGVRALHQLSRRWLVFVPAGFVIHDHVLLSEPSLIPRKVIENLGLVENTENYRARRDHENLEIVDLTGGASGLVVEVETSSDIGMTLKGRGATREATSRLIRFSPTLPGKVLTEARVRGIRVGLSKRKSKNPNSSEQSP